jgi:hypothetical protein
MGEGIVAVASTALPAVGRSDAAELFTGREADDLQGNRGCHSGAATLFSARLTLDGNFVPLRTYPT